MAGEYRGVQWRQGELLVLHDTLVLLISHECDICADEEVEPLIEYIPCAIDVKSNGSVTLAKNPRRLQIDCFAPGVAEPRVIEVVAREKRAYAKGDFVREARTFDWQVQPEQQVVIRRWLSARYSRSAFPNAFESLMQDISEAIDKLSKRQGSGIRALYFDLDGGQMLERDDPSDPYELAIYVVYPFDTDDAVAGQFAAALSAIFEAAFKKGDQWQGIHLVTCDAVSEDSFPLSMHNSTKTWRVDHRSLGGDPASQYLPEPDR